MEANHLKSSRAQSGAADRMTVQNASGARPNLLSGMTAAVCITRIIPASTLVLVALAKNLTRAAAA